jgi:hypothetical protein
MNPETQPYGTKDADGENPEPLVEGGGDNGAPNLGGRMSAPDDAQAARLMEENGFHWLGGQLRDMYEEVVHEPLPDQFLDLLQKLDARDDQSSPAPAALASSTSVDTSAEEEL